jgi:hypothetical protein
MQLDYASIESLYVCFGGGILRVMWGSLEDADDASARRLSSKEVKIVFYYSRM